MSTHDSGSEGGSREARKRPRRHAVRLDTRGVSAGTGSVCKLFVRKAPCNFADPWRKHSA